MCSTGFAWNVESSERLHTCIACDIQNEHNTANCWENLFIYDVI